jgi:hypothetical protein
VEDAPEMFLPIPGGWGKMGRTHIRLAAASEDVLKSALPTAWSCEAYESEANIGSAMRYRLFGRGTGLRVSELALGGALFGIAWGYGTEPGEALRILEAYADAGGNFIDTSDSYQFGQSETIVGDFLVEFIVASKYILGAEPDAHV